MATKVQIEVDERTLKNLVRQYLSQQVGTELDDKDIRIETKSKQNYKSEWEQAAFRATVDKIIND
jgi:hypothetical protein